jgi:hypothetical protein
VLVVIFADAEDVLGHPSTGANGSGETCLLRYLFLDATARDFIGDWESRAQWLLAEFPADTAHNREDLGMQDLVRGAGVSTINHNPTALRLLFMVMLREHDVVARLPFVLEPRRLPVVLSPEEPRHVACVHFPYIKH